MAPFFMPKYDLSRKYNRAKPCKTQYERYLRYWSIIFHERSR